MLKPSCWKSLQLVRHGFPGWVLSLFDRLLFHDDHKAKVPPATLNTRTPSIKTLQHQCSVHPRPSWIVMCACDLLTLCLYMYMHECITFALWENVFTWTSLLQFRLLLPLPCKTYKLHVKFTLNFGNFTKHKVNSKFILWLCFYFFTKHLSIFFSWLFTSIK